MYVCMCMRYEQASLQQMPSIASLNERIGLFNILLLVGEEDRTGAIMSNALMVSTCRLGCPLPVSGRLLAG